MNYLYQLDLYINDPYFCDMTFCARFIPKIISLGARFDKFIQIINLDAKLEKILKKRNNDFESGLFELLVATMYINDNATDVELITESSEKTPDIKFIKNGITFYAECKKKIKESNYTENERKKWYELFKPVKQFILNNNLSIIVNVTFHKELHLYKDDYLITILTEILLSNETGHIINNENVSIIIHNIYLERTINHLKDNFVRCDTPLIHKLLFDFYDPSKGITYGLKCRKHPEFDKYIVDLSDGYAGIWSCDSIDSANKKAGSFKKRVSKALEQFPDESNCFIHLCYEPYDGDFVKLMLLDKNITDLQFFDYCNKKLQTIYLHILDFKMTPDTLWEFDEDCLCLVNNNIDNIEVINNLKLLENYIE